MFFEKIFFSNNIGRGDPHSMPEHQNRPSSLGERSSASLANFENFMFFRKFHDFSKKSLIFRENHVFFAQNYYFSKIHDFEIKNFRWRKNMFFFWKNIFFHKIWVDEIPVACPNIGIGPVVSENGPPQVWRISKNRSSVEFRALNPPLVVECCETRGEVTR